MSTGVQQETESRAEAEHEENWRHQKLREIELSEDHKLKEEIRHKWDEREKKKVLLASGAAVR